MRIDFDAQIEIEKLLKALYWLEQWHRENIDGRHHCPWCYCRGEKKDGGDMGWDEIVHSNDCVIGAVYYTKRKGVVTKKDDDDYDCSDAVTECGNK